MIKLGGDGFGDGFDGDDPMGGLGRGKGNKEFPDDDIVKKDYSTADTAGKGDNQASIPFGHPGIKPSFLFCKKCQEYFLSQDVIWDDNRAKCPKCGHFIR